MARNSSGFSLPYILLMALISFSVLVLLLSITAPGVHPSLAAIRDYFTGTSVGDALLEQGLDALNDGKNEEAIRLLEEARQADQEEAYTWLAHAYDRAGRMDDALDAHKEAVRFHPDLAAAWINFGITYRRMHELEKAETCYDRAMALNPENEKLHANLGVLYLEQGRIEEALEVLHKAIRLAPEWGTPHANLASVQARAGRFDEAFGSIDRAEELGYVNTEKVRAQIEKIKELRAAFRLAEGVAVEDLEGVHEGFAVKETEQGYGRIVLNVSAGRINAVVFALMSLIEGPGYLVLEVAGPVGRVEIYQLDHLEVEAFQEIFVEFNEFFIHDGTLAFAFHDYQGVDRVSLNRYKTVSILTEDRDKYVRRLESLGYSRFDDLKTLEQLVTPGKPGSLEGIRVGERTAADVVEALKARGMNWVEQR